MKQTTKRYLSIAAASALVVGVATGVLARGGFGPGFGPGWGGHHGMMGGPGGMHGRNGGPGWMMSGDPVAYADRQLAELKTELAITADQEAAWNAYAAAVKGKAAVMLSHRQTMLDSGAMNPELRFAFHQQGMAQMQQVTSARRDLYAVLSPEQQSRAGFYQGRR